MPYSEHGMILNKYADKKWVRCVNDFLDSNAFIALLAIVTALSNLLGAEIFVYPLIISYGVYLCLFGRDMRSVAAAIPFMYLSPSLHNNPGSNPNSIFTPEHGLWLIVAYLLLFLCVLSVRIFLGIKRKLFGKTQWKLLPSFAFLGVAFLLAGVGQREYSFLDFRYAAVLFLSLFLVYFFLILLVDWKTVRRDYFAQIGMFMGLIVVVELLNIYFQGNVIDELGHINKDLVFTGWGISNNLGGVLICAIPCAFYLAREAKASWSYVLLATIIYVATIFTGSRNCTLVGGIIYLVSLALTLSNRETQSQTVTTVFVVLLAFLFLRAVNPDVFNNIFARFEQKISNDGRVGIYEKGFLQFLDAPFSGKGFFACDVYAWGTEKLSLVPPRWHSTVIQLLASCGVLGLLAYGYHRYQTVLLWGKKPSKEKIFIALSLTALLLSSLLDCFMFNLGPGLFYSMAVAFLEKSDETFPKKRRLLGGRTLADRDGVNI